MRNFFNYSYLAFPLAFASIPIYMLAPDIYARNYDISLSELGFCLLILRILDAILDPLIGFLSDKITKYLSNLIGFSLFVMLIGFYFLFNPIYMNIIWFAAFIFLATTGYSIASINFQALGGRWLLKTNLYTKVTTFREFFGLLGLVVAVVLPTILAPFFPENLIYKIISFILLFCIILSFIAFKYWLKTADISKNNNKLEKANFNFKSNLSFYGLYMLNSFAGAIPAVLMLFFVRDVLHAANLSGMFLFAYFVSAGLAMPVWHKLALAFGKKRAWCIGILLAALTFVWAFFLHAGYIWHFFIICVLSGLALGADLSLPPAILAHRLNQKKQLNAASCYYALLNFSAKFAFALASGIVLPVLSKLGYKPGYAMSVGYLNYAYALIPSMIKLTVALLLSLKEDII